MTKKAACTSVQCGFLFLITVSLEKSSFLFCLSLWIAKLNYAFSYIFEYNGPIQKRRDNGTDRSMKKNWKPFGARDFWARSPLEIDGGYYKAALDVMVWSGTPNGEYLHACSLVTSELPTKCDDWDPQVISAVKAAVELTSLDLISTAHSLKL